MIIGYIICAAGFSSAQVPDLKFEHITSEDGLPQSTIHGIVKDKYGFMWFGTWGGLCRFDGYSFKIYRYNSSDNKSINNNRIHNIIKDSDQNIWILTFQEDELCRYNYEKDNFDRIPEDRVSGAFRRLISRREHFLTVNYSYKGFRWTLDSVSNSLVQTNLKTGKRNVYDYVPGNRWSVNDIYATDIYKDDNDILWIGSFSNGINKANLNAKPFNYYYHNPADPESIIDNNVRSICEDKAGNLWVGTRDKGITVIGKNHYRHITAGNNSIKDNQIRQTFCDSRGIIWIGTKLGLNSYDPKSGAFREYKAHGLASTTVFGAAEDADHNLWFASWKGVYKYKPKDDKLIHFDPATTLKSQYCHVVLEDRSRQIWVGTEGGGVTILKPVPGTDKVIVRKHLVHDHAKVNTICDNRINCLYEDSEGFIWIGTGNGLDRYDPRAGKFTHLSEPSGLMDATISGVIEDGNGYLWVSHKSGILRLDKKTFQSRNYTIQDGLQSNEFSDNAVFKSRHQNILYFGSNDGLNAFDPDDIFPERTVPKTVLTDLQILNHRVEINQEINGRVVLTKPLYLTDEIVLRNGDKSISIEFAGLHYSNPMGNQYAYMLEGFDKDWVYTDANRRIANYSNLAPGNYVFKAKSSNPDGVWNPNPTVLRVIVKPPFYASNWAYFLYTILIGAAIYTYLYYSIRLNKLRTKLSYEQLIREKENELHQNKLQFFTNISHEIKTPLTLVLAPIEKLMNRFPDNKLLSDEMRVMKTNGDRLLKLINQLLDFRKLETGNLKLNLQNQDIVFFLNSLVGAFEPLAEAKNVTIEFVKERDSFYLFYDEDKLEKVMANLLSNALKFTPDSGLIKLIFDVKSTGNQTSVLIKLINEGIFIPESEREKIFEPFQQGSGSKEGGTGLGLAYSKGLIELHSGTLTVNSLYSAGVRSETAFIVELPVNTQAGGLTEGSEVPDETAVVFSGIEKINEDANPAISTLKEKRPLIDGKIPVILIVEDSTDLRRYLYAHFECSYHVLEAENGRQALEIASDGLPDLIISDVMMPEMDGFELCRRIKTEGKTAHIPVILLTARTPVEDKLEGIETGADDYITKPFNLTLLTARVRAILITRNKLKEKYRKEISLEPTKEVPLSPDEKLMRKLLQYIEERLPDPELNIDNICARIGISRSQLYRKVKSMTGLSMAEVIKEIRFKRAKQLLKDHKFNINEVAFMVGFSDSDYFRKCFKAEFGITPTEYCRGMQDNSVEKDH